MKYRDITIEERYSSTIMIIVKIIMNVLPEKRKEVLQTLLSMIKPIRQEKGSRSYQAFQDIENENIFSLVGEWETLEDLERHIRSDRFAVIIGSNILLNENQEIKIYTVSQIEGSGIVNAVRRGKRIWPDLNSQDSERKES